VRRSRLAPRSAVVLAAVVAALAPAAAQGAKSRFIGRVTDPLGTPIHSIRAGAGGAVVRLVFEDRRVSGTRYRACVRLDGSHHTPVCLSGVATQAGTPYAWQTTLPQGHYLATWRVAGKVVAQWKLRVS
jgi:hypothetical protein